GAGSGGPRRPGGPAIPPSPRKKRRSAAKASASAAAESVTTTGRRRCSSRRARQSAGALPRNPPTRTRAVGDASSSRPSRSTSRASDAAATVSAIAARRRSGKPPGTYLPLSARVAHDRVERHHQMALVRVIREDVDRSLHGAGRNVVTEPERQAILEAVP